MKNLAELHTEHSEITSEIVFLKKEIDFLLKLLRNAYSTSVNMQKIKLLDGYWKSFEETIDQLDLLLKRIQKEEKELSGIFQDNLIDMNKTLFLEENIVSEFYRINGAVKVLKESYYEFMAGCCACSYKKN